MSEQNSRIPPAANRPGHGGFGGGGPAGALLRPVEKAKNFKGTLKRLLTYVRPYTLSVLAVLFLSVAATVMSVVSPKILGNITTMLFDTVSARVLKGVTIAVDFKAIGNIVLILTILYIGSALFSYIQQYIMAGVAQKTVASLRVELNGRISRLPLKFIDGRPHGELMSRMTNDIDNISNTLQQGLTQIFSSLLTLIGTIGIMLFISPLLTLIVVVTIPLSIIITAGVAKRSQKHFAEQQKVLGALNGHVEEMLTGHKVVKAFGYEKKSLGRFESKNKELYDAGFKAQFLSGLMMPLLSFVNNLGYVLVCIVGGVLAMKKAITVGDVQAFIQYARQFSQPIMQTANIANVIQSTIASAERVFELLDEKEEQPEAPLAKELREVRGEVRFENVRFGYSENTTVIKGLNLEVAQGQTIAIVGPTGAGKTTLVNLLLRFYDVDQGKITIDGLDIRGLTRKSLRGAFGMVLQDTWLFEGSIYENIAYGKTGCTEEEVHNASKAAFADHFIRTLPDGYQSVLHEDASNLSTGQKQLITIARAFLADPAILILDEATSSVDTRTEVTIQSAMHELMKGRTSFVIAHRLSTIRGADQILVMKDGDIIEKGSHQSLLEQEGFYTALYRSQYSGAFVNEEEAGRKGQFLNGRRSLPGRPGL